MSVCVSVWKVYCGKTTEWIQIPFGVVSGVGRGMGVLDGGRDRRREGALWGLVIKIIQAYQIQNKRETEKN